MPASLLNADEELRLRLGFRKRQHELREAQRQASMGATEKYRDDPVGFIREQLGEEVWSKQDQVARAVALHRRVSVPAAHSMGKSFLASRLVAWWLICHPVGEAFVVTTATTANQVRAVLWREIRRAHSKGGLLGRLNQTEWFINDELVAFGRKPADYDPTAFQGIHARFVLVIIDEAAGVPKDIYDAAASLTSNRFGRLLAIGNPTDPTSYFATICKPGSGWETIHISALESPNFTDEAVSDSLREMLMSTEYAKEIEAEHGTDGAMYVARVKGEFPEDSAEGVIPLSFIRKCQQEPDLTDDQLLPVEIGFDVGAGGDMAVLRERRGMRVGRTARVRTADAMELVGHAVKFIQDTGATRLKIDVIGIGWGIAGRLEELYNEGVHTCEIVKVNVGEASSDPARFPKLRDEIWWMGRELCQDMAVDLTGLDDTTIGQLIAPTWKPDSAARVSVERKEETKKRLKRSPDDGDAFLLAYYGGGGGGSIWFA